MLADAHIRAWAACGLSEVFQLGFLPSNVTFFFSGIYFWIHITLKQIPNCYALFMLMDQILVSALYIDRPLNASDMPCFSFPFFSFFFSIRRPTYCRNMLCSRHWGMQIGKRAKKTRKKEVRVLTPSTAHSFQPRPAGLDLSGTLSLASVCETHIKCVSVPLNSS